MSPGKWGVSQTGLQGAGSPLVEGREGKPIQGQGHLGNTSEERGPCPWAGEGEMPWRLSQRDTCWEAGPGAISGPVLGA